MWWMMAAAVSAAAYEPKITVPVIDTDSSIAVGAVPLRTGFDLGAAHDRDDHRLRASDYAVAQDDPRNPFIVSALEDDRQQLTFGVKPGLRRARLGVSYRLSLD